MSLTHVETFTTHVEIQHLTIVLLCLKVQIIYYIVLSLSHVGVSEFNLIVGYKMTESIPKQKHFLLLFVQRNLMPF